MGIRSGGVQATLVTDEWLNDVQEELVNVLSAAGIAPVKGTQNQLLSALRGLSAGVIGTIRNGRMAVASASASATYVADQIIVQTSLTGQTFRLANFNKTVNVAALGAGGMDTGSAPTSGYVAVYAIYNPETQVSALLAVNTTAVLAPEIYGGANMPSGYTASALLAVVPTTAAGFFYACIVKDRKVFLGVSSFISGSSILTDASISIAGTVPLNVKEIFGEFSMSATALTVCSIAISATTGAIGQQVSRMTLGAGQVLVANYANVPVDSARIVYMTTTSTAGTTTFIGYINGYSI